MRVLVIEDDSDTSAYIARGLKEAGHTVDTVRDGKDGLFLAANSAFDLLIVDRMVPGVDGLSAVKSLRAMGLQTPILMLTAMGSVNDRVSGLKAGADDYLVKPFSFAELHARAEALGRRPPLKAPEQTAITLGDLELDRLRRTVRRGQRMLDLKAREFQLLEFLMLNAERVVTRTMLLEHIWEFPFDPKTNIVETHISRLRAKLDGEGEAQMLHTVRRAGYVIRAP